jgi:nitrogen fixation NifU-like protein
MDLGALYQEVILEHNRSPKNMGELPDATGHAHGKNPLCGDEVSVWVHTTGDVVDRVTFTGHGCAISRASASMMTQALSGKTQTEALALFAHFHDMVTGATPVNEQLLGKLKVFGGVSRFPARVKCASLAWHAFRDALRGASGDGDTAR